MANNFDNQFVGNVIGLWDFLDGSKTEDTGLDDGFAQNGHTQGDAFISGDALHTNGCGHFDVNNMTGFDGTSNFPGNDVPFQLDEGTVEVVFTQDKHVNDSPDTLVSRGEYADRHDEGFFEIRVTKDGKVEAVHFANGDNVKLATGKDFFDPGDEVKVAYSWDKDDGLTLVVENLTDGTTETITSDETGFDMKIGDNDDESWTFAARETDDGHYGRYFDGSIDYVAIYDIDIQNQPELDGIVEGSSGDDLIDIGYTGDPEGDRIDALDSLTPPNTNDDVVDAFGGDDTIEAGEGDDTVYAGSGNDSVEGESGDDVLFGDGNLDPTGGGTVRESFEWDKAPDPNGSGAIEDGDPLDGGFTQNTGNVDVTFSVTKNDPDADTEFADNNQNVSGIVADGNPVDDNSSLDSELENHGDEVKYELNFSEEVENVSFRVNDIDGDGVVRVKAWDAGGNQIEISLTAGNNLTLIDTGGAPGADTADSNGGYESDTSPNYSILVDIPGPVSRIEITHSQNGNADSGVNVTDVYFDVPLGDTGDDGNDTIDGGTGNDEIFGEGGNDSLDGGDDNDLVVGGDGDDTVKGGKGDDELRGNDGNDSLDGGDGDDSMGGAEGNDILQGGAGHDTLTGGSGNDTLDGGADSDTITGGSGNDEITDTDGDNLVNAGIDGAPDRGFPFVGQADADPNDDKDTVTTGDGNDTITTGDDDDVVDAGNGDNIIDVGFDDDDVTSGSGNDEITLGEGSDTVDSGDGADTIYGGLGPGLGDSANLIDENVNPLINDPILDNGDDLIDAGAGNDLVFGEDDNDTIFGGSGDDTLDGGVDDDEIFGGEGDDLIVGGQGADTLSGGFGDDRFNVGTFTDPIPGNDDYVEGIGDEIIGGEDADDNDVDVLDLTGSGAVRVVYDADLPPADQVDPTGTPGESGRVFFYDGNGFDDSNIVGELTFKEIENVIPCFTPGSRIATPKGEVPVESLKEGDKVITRDNGIQEIRWVGNRTLQRDELRRAPYLRPILIKAGSLGDGLPERDMLVSPQHRMLVSGDATQLYFEESEVLVAAKHLVNHGGVQWLDPLRVSYIHFMFDHHEVVLADGAWTESFQPGDQTLGAMGNGARNEILELFPDLRSPAGRDSYVAARRSLKAHEARLITR